jgi:hypothetical protein
LGDGDPIELVVESGGDGGKNPYSCLIFKFQDGAE